MATKRNPGMALIEAIQFLLDEVVKFDTDPSKVQKAASLRAEINELEAYENDLTQAEQERVAFFEEQDQLHKAQISGKLDGLAGGFDGQPFEPEMGRASLIAGAIDEMKRALEGGKADPAATNNPEAGQ